MKSLNLLDKKMLKLVKIEKEALVYKSMPIFVFVLKWVDAKVSAFLQSFSRFAVKLNKNYQSKVSNKIDKLYAKKSITKITPKYPKVKKK